MDPTTTVQIKGALYTAGLPIFGIILGGLLGRALAKRSGKPQRWPLAVGLALGLAAAHVGISGGLPEWPISDGAAWLPFLLIGALALFVTLDRGERPQPALKVIPLILVGVAALMYLTLRVSIEQTWETSGDLLKHVGAPAGLALLVWIGVDRAQTRAVTPAIFAALCIASLGAAGTAILGSSAKLAQIFGALGAASGVATLVSWYWSDLKIGHSGVAVLIMGYMGTLVYAHHYAYPGLPVSSLLLLATAPLAAVVATVVPKTFPALVVTTLVALAPAGSAAWITQAQIAADAAADEDKSDSPFGEGYVEPTY